MNPETLPAAPEPGVFSSHKITDQNGRSLPYVFCPSENPADPILIKFHGWVGNNDRRNLSPLVHAERNWNVIHPLDRYGLNRMGSWWLGDQGDFFFLDLIDCLINELREKYKLTGDLYCYGTSMGGFGAALHGMRHSARGFVLNMPQTCLIGTTLTQGMWGFLKYVFGVDDEYLQSSACLEDNKPELETLLHHTDLTRQVLNLNSNYSPVFHIIQTRYDATDRGHLKNTYLSEQTLRFVNALIKKNLPFSLSVENATGHYIRWSIQDAFRILDPTHHQPDEYLSSKKS